MVMVAICDDEREIGAELETVLIDIFGRLKLQAEIDVFFSGEELCRHLEKGTHYDLIYLDIEFAKGEINGVEVGRIIRDVHQNNLVAIVYISWETKYAMQLFEMQPLHFLPKPLAHEKIERTVRTYLKVADIWSGVFTYKAGHEVFKVKIKEIIYIESRDRKLVLHLTDNRTDEFYGKIKEVYEEQLKKFDFLYIHASFLVNFDYVTSMKYNKLFLANNVTPLPITQSKRDDVRAVYYGIIERRRV